MACRYTRRRVLIGLSCAGVAPLVAVPRALAADPPPETTSVRIPRFVGAPLTCLAPLYAAEEFLRAEGFDDLRYIDVQGSAYLEAVGRGTVDFAQDFVVSALRRIDAGDPTTLLAGLHVGCFEGFANDSVRSVRDLKGKRVGVFPDITEYWLLKIMAAYVGLDPARDIHWVDTQHPIDLMWALPTPRVPAFRRSSRSTAVAFSIARTTRLVATGYFRTNSRFPSNTQQKYCDHGRSTAVLTKERPSFRARISNVWVAMVA